METATDAVEVVENVELYTNQQDVIDNKIGNIVGRFSSLDIIDKSEDGNPTVILEKTVNFPVKLTIVASPGGGATLNVNGRGGSFYQNFIGDELLSFLEEGATAVQAKIASLEDPAKNVMIAKADALRDQLDK